MPHAISFTYAQIRTAPNEDRRDADPAYERWSPLVSIVKDLVGESRSAWALLWRAVKGDDATPNREMSHLQLGMWTARKYVLIRCRMSAWRKWYER